jgi:hypothetical protein
LSTVPISIYSSFLLTVPSPFNCLIDLITSSCSTYSSLSSWFICLLTISLKVSSLKDSLLSNFTLWSYIVEFLERS